MPMRAHDSGRRADLGRDDLKLLLRDPANVNLNVNGLINTELRDHSTGQYIQVLESLDDPSDSTGISVGEDPQPE
jgi:hypothetical protein